MFKKIRSKYFLICSAFFCLLSIAYYLYQSGGYIKQKEIEINDIMAVISGHIIIDVQKNLYDSSTEESNIEPEVNRYISYFVVTGDSNKIIKSFNLNAAKENNYLQTSYIPVTKLKNNLIRKSYHFKINKAQNAMLYIGLFVPNLMEDISSNNSEIIKVSALIFIIGFIFSAAFISLVYMPVKKVLNAADAIDVGNYRKKKIFEKFDEFGIILHILELIPEKIGDLEGQIYNLKQEASYLFRDKIGEVEFEINQRKHFENALKESEEQFRLLVELAPVGMVLTSPDNKITKVNLSFCETTGYTAEELLNRPIEEITVKEDWAKEEFLNKRLMNNRASDLADWPESNEEDWEQKLSASKKMLNEDLSDIYFEKRFINKNGKIVYAIVKSILLRDTKERPLNFVSQVIDISERKEVEKELILAKDKAEASDRLKSAFLAQMSHEIRTPLNVILNVTPIVSDELAVLKDEELNTLMESMDSAGKRLQRTIDLILNMSSIQSGNYEPDFELIDAEKQLKTVIKELKPLCTEKGLELNFDSYIDSPKVNVDLYTFNQIFQNLIGNAVKYTPKGSITVRIYEEGKGKICIAVKDSGIGISEDYMEKLFTPFSQEDVGQKREFEGNGLGLALVKKYVELNKADIKVESSKGFGSIFTVVFNKPAVN